MAMRIFAAVLAGLALGCLTASIEQASAATPVPLAQLLQQDMTQPHEYVPHGVPPSYDWQLGPKTSPPPPSTFKATTAWGQWYRCATAGLDDNDVAEIQNMQTWVMGPDSSWRLSQATSIPFGGAAYAEDFHSPPVPANVVATAPYSWIKARMSPEGYNLHLYPQRRGGYDAATDRAVVVIVEAKLWAYSPSTQCTVLGAGIDFWSTTSSSTVWGGSLGRLKHLDTATRAFTATAGDMAAVLASPPPVTLPVSELR